MAQQNKHKKQKLNFQITDIQAQVWSQALWALGNVRESL